MKSQKQTVTEAADNAKSLGFKVYSITTQPGFSETRYFLNIENKNGVISRYDAIQAKRLFCKR